MTLHEKYLGVIPCHCRRLLINPALPVHAYLDPSLQMRLCSLRFCPPSRSTGQNRSLSTLSGMSKYSTCAVAALTMESDKMSSSIWGRQPSSLSLITSNEASEKILGCLWRSWANNCRNCSSFSVVLSREGSDSRSILASSLITSVEVPDELRIVARSSRAIGFSTLGVQNFNRS